MNENLYEKDKENIFDCFLSNPVKKAIPIFEDGFFLENDKALELLTKCYFIAYYQYDIS